MLTDHLTSGGAVSLADTWDGMGSMSSTGSMWMRQAAAQLKDLDGPLVRASAGAGEFKVEAEALQASVHAAAAAAADLARRMQDAPAGGEAS